MSRRGSLRRGGGRAGCSDQGQGFQGGTTRTNDEKSKQPLAGRVMGLGTSFPRADKQMESSAVEAANAMVTFKRSVDERTGRDAAS